MLLLLPALRAYLFYSIYLLRWDHTSRHSRCDQPGWDTWILLIRALAPASAPALLAALVPLPVEPLAFDPAVKDGLAAGAALGAPALAASRARGSATVISNSQASVMLAWLSDKFRLSLPCVGAQMVCADHMKRQGASIFEGVQCGPTSRVTPPCQTATAG